MALEKPPSCCRDVLIEQSLILPLHGRPGNRFSAAKATTNGDIALWDERARCPCFFDLCGCLAPIGCIPLRGLASTGYPLRIEKRRGDAYARRRASAGAGSAASADRVSEPRGGKEVMKTGRGRGSGRFHAIAPTDQGRGSFRVENGFQSLRDFVFVRPR
jgi:hypothetical protein